MISSWKGVSSELAATRLLGGWRGFVVLAVTAASVRLFWQRGWSSAIGLLLVTDESAQLEGASHCMQDLLTEVAVYEVRVIWEST